MEGTNLGSSDVVVMQVDSTASVLWTEQFGTSGSDGIEPGREPTMAIDSTGDLFITGYTCGDFSGYSNQGSIDWFLYKVEAKSRTTSSSTQYHIRHYHFVDNKHCFLIEYRRAHLLPQEPWLQWQSEVK